MVAHLTIQSRGDVRFDLVAQLFFKNFSFFSCINEKIFSYLYYQNEIIIKSNTMKNQNNRLERVSNQIKTNIDFLCSKEGWSKVKGILTMAAFDMSKKERKEFFEAMRDENKKRDFLIYLFATTSIEAALIQQK